jgi:hypothetical protein
LVAAVLVEQLTQALILRILLNTEDKVGIASLVTLLLLAAVVELCLSTIHLTLETVVQAEAAVTITQA